MDGNDVSEARGDGTPDGLIDGRPCRDWSSNVVAINPLRGYCPGEAEGIVGASLFCEAAITMAPKRMIRSNDSVNRLCLYHVPLWIAQFDGRLYLMPVNNGDRKTLGLHHVDQGSARDIIERVEPPSDFKQLDEFLEPLLDEVRDSVSGVATTLPDPEASCTYSGNLDPKAFVSQYEMTNSIQVLDRCDNIDLDALGVYHGSPSTEVSIDHVEMTGMMDLIAGMKSEIEGLERLCDAESDDFFLDPLYDVLDDCIERFHEEQRPFIESLQTEIDLLEDQVREPQVQMEGEYNYARSDLLQKTNSIKNQLEGSYGGRYKALGAIYEKTSREYDAYRNRCSHQVDGLRDQVARLESQRNEHLANVRVHEVRFQQNYAYAMTSGDPVAQTSLVAIQSVINDSTKKANLLGHEIAERRSLINAYHTDVGEYRHHLNQLDNEMKRLEEEYNGRIEATTREYNETRSKLHEAENEEIAQLRAPITERENKIAHYHDQESDYIEWVQMWAERFHTVFMEVLDEMKTTLADIEEQVSVKGCFRTDDLNDAINLVLLPITEICYTKGNKEIRRLVQAGRVKYQVEKKSMLTKQVHILHEVDVGLCQVKSEQIEPFLSKDLLPSVNEYYKKLKAMGIMEPKHVKHIERFFD